MRTIIAVIIFFVLTTSGYAQKTIKIKDNNDHEIETLFKHDRRDGFYGSISLGYSPINESDGIVFSARGCWIMDHWFAIGVGGTAFVNNFDEIPHYDQNPIQLNNSIHLTGGYGGFIIEPMFAPTKPLHLSFPMLLGAGGASIYSDYYYSTDYSLDDFFMIFEPGIELEVNFTRWLRIAAYATYRITSDLEIKNIKPDALQTYTVGLNFKFGLF